jgi:heme-degrading monooxygenase HmoA
MIRVIYRWQVRPGKEAAFTSAWERATTMIRANTQGARGSILLQSRDNPTEYMTIARWDNLEDWQLFWQGKSPHVPVEMQTMHDVAELLAKQVFDEIQDCTL